MNMKMTVSKGYQLICGCTLIGYVLGGHVFSNSVLDTNKAEEANKRQTLICNNHCPFGFVPDVEGDLTCRCYDPCSYIMCLQGTVCVAEMPKDCKWEPCTAITRCEDKSDVVQTVLKKEQPGQIWRDIPEGIQQDGPGWTDLQDIGDVCSKPLPTAAVSCDHKRRRWFYNSMTGKCERFIGCPTFGNNFARKIYCKEQCRYRYMKKANVKSLKVPNINDDICFQPLYDNAKSCDTSFQSKRWHYNVKSGKCEKFIGCVTTGNNFSRKISCKSKCLKKRTFTHFYKDTHSRSRSAR